MADDLVQRLRALSRYEHDNVLIGYEAADALARKDAEIAALCKAVVGFRSQARLDQALIEGLEARAERAEARVREAPVISIGSKSQALRMVYTALEPFIGKRVALVPLDTEEAK